MQQSLFGYVEAPTVADVQKDLSQELLSEVVFTVIDLETTGLSAKKNDITELTAIQFKNGVEVAKYSTLVKPTEAIPPEVEDLTGITNEMVQNAPALVMVLGELMNFFGPQPIIVGHNVPFDIGFIREKATQHGFTGLLERVDSKRALCTKALAVKALPGLPSYEGVVVATQCNVYNPCPHRAESDVRMSAGILFAIMERLQAKDASLHTLGDLLRYQGELAER